MTHTPVIWCFLLGACELIHISVCKETNFSDFAENILCHCIKFSRYGVKAPGVYAFLVYVKPV